MRGLPGWGMFALLVAIIALSFPPSENRQKEIVPDQVTMGAPTTMPAFARAIHIQKSEPPTADILPLYEGTALAIWKGEVAYASRLTVGLASTTISPSTAREQTSRSQTDRRRAGKRVLLFWKGAGRSSIAILA